MQTGYNLQGCNKLNRTNATIRVQQQVDRSIENCFYIAHKARCEDRATNQREARRAKR